MEEIEAFDETQETPENVVEMEADPEEVEQRFTTVALG